MKYYHLFTFCIVISFFKTFLQRTHFISTNAHGLRPAPPTIALMKTIAFFIVYMTIDYYFIKILCAIVVLFVCLNLINFFSSGGVRTFHCFFYVVDYFSGD